MTRKQLDRRTVAINRIVVRELVAKGYKHHDWHLIEYMNKELRHIHIVDAADLIVGTLVRNIKRSYAERMTFGA